LDTLLRFGLAACAVAAAGDAYGFSCAPVGNPECRIELSQLAIVFDPGVRNFVGESQPKGPDDHIQGHTCGSGEFPEPTLIDDVGVRAAAGASRAGNGRMVSTIISATTPEQPDPDQDPDTRSTPLSPQLPGTIDRIRWEDRDPAR